MRFFQCWRELQLHVPADSGEEGTIDMVYGVTMLTPMVEMGWGLVENFGDICMTNSPQTRKFRVFWAPWPDTAKSTKMLENGTPQKTGYFLVNVMALTARQRGSGAGAPPLMSP